MEEPGRTLKWRLVAGRFVTRALPHHPPHRRQCVLHPRRALPAHHGVGQAAPVEFGQRPLHKRPADVGLPEIADAIFHPGQINIGDEVKRCCVRQLRKGGVLPAVQHLCPDGGHHGIGITDHPASPGRLCPRDGGGDAAFLFGRDHHQIRHAGVAAIGLTPFPPKFADNLHRAGRVGEMLRQSGGKHRLAGAFRAVEADGAGGHAAKVMRVRMRLARAGGPLRGAIRSGPRPPCRGRPHTGR